jgi:hypothetical protein
MFEVLVSFIMDGEVHVARRMYHPPLIGDEHEFASGSTGRVVARVWRNSNVEAQHVEIHMVRVVKEVAVKQRRKRK